MPPRLPHPTRGCASRALRPTANSTRASILRTSQNDLTITTPLTKTYATTSPIPLGSLRLPDDYIPPTQPPTARRPELRKAQLIRTYTALLRSTPLILFFQHNNLTAVEWAAVRRELRAALAQVPLPATLADGSVPVDITPTIEIQVLRTRMFTVASKIVEYFKPEAEAFKEKSNTYTHDLSTSAYEASKNATVQEDDMFSQLAPLLTGPVAAVTFPSVSPAHLAAVLKVLSPSSPAFPAPTRKKNPGYWDPTAQAGLQKLLMIGGRIEGKAFDTDGVKWVGGIEGGLDGLRAQLVHMLQSAGMGLTTALEGHSKGLWLALEGRRTQLEEEANPGKKEGEGEGEGEKSEAA